MTFKASISAATLKHIFLSLKDLCQDVNLMVSSDGVSITAMDTAHVSLSRLRLPMTAFTSFHVDRDECLGVNVATLCTLLNCCNKDTDVVLETGDDGLHLTSVSPTMTTAFCMHLLHIDADDVDIPDVEYSNTIQLPSATYKHIVTDALRFGQSTTITMATDSVRLVTSGDMGTFATTLTPNDTTTIASSTDFTCTLATRYLHVFSKACTLSSSVSLMGSEGLPMCVHFAFEGGGEMAFYLAPQV